MELSLNNKNYIKATLSIYDIEKDTETPKYEFESHNIHSIFINENEHVEVFDHAFYINDAGEFLDYENCDEFCDVIADMVLDEFADDYILDENDRESIFLEFCDSEADEVKFIVLIGFDDDGEINICAVDIEFTDEDDECDGDCENCDFYNKGEDADDYHYTHYTLGYR